MLGPCEPVRPCSAVGSYFRPPAWRQSETGERMVSSDDQGLDVEALHDRPSTLTEASKRIDESLDFDTVSQVVVDRGRALTGSPYGVSTTLDDSGLPKVLATSGMAQGDHRALGNYLPEGLLA